MDLTTNYKLKKPGASDYYSIDDFNDNADAIDAALIAIDTALAGKAPASHSHTKSQITDFPSSMAPSAHAASHATGGGDPITPASIGAVNQKVVYYPEEVSADDVTDAAFLLSISSEKNPELYSILAEQYAYIVQIYYADTGYRLQIAHGYIHNKMASRISYSGNWNSWSPIYTSEYLPYTYSTIDLTAGSSALTTDKLYFVYE